MNQMIKRHFNCVSVRVGFARVACVSLIAASLSCAPASRTSGEAKIAKSKLNGASFAQRQVRYMTPFDLMETLKVSFGEAAGHIDQGCVEINDDNRGLLGDSVAATGSPIFSEPGSSFVRWYFKCETAYIAQLAASVGANVAGRDEMLYGPTLLALVKRDPLFLNQKFSRLPRYQRLAIARDAIERLIGPSEIIADFGFFKSSDELAQKVADDVDPNVTVQEAIKAILASVAIRDEFLSY